MRLLLTLLAVTVAGVAALTLTAHASPTKHWDRHRVNIVRADHHVPLVHYRRRLQHRAQRWAEHIASTGILRDDTRGARVCWRLNGHLYGGNSGQGPTVRAIQRALEHSPPHLANMVDPAFRWLGIGVARGHGTVWLVQDYCG